MSSAIEVSNYIIDSVTVDNLKLQKLLYYSQGVHMVLKGTPFMPLFPEVIEAWQYGPVVPVVYRKYKSHGLDPILRPSGRGCRLTQEELKSVDIVLDYYGEMSGVQLIGRTHQESPWKDVYVPNRRHIPITNVSIFNYFNRVLQFDEAE